MPSNWEFIAPMVLGVTFILTGGLVILLRPVSRRLADLLEIMVQERRKGVPPEVHQVTRAVGTLESRVALLEERLDFTDSLLGRGEHARLPEAPDTQR